MTFLGPKVGKEMGDHFRYNNEDLEVGSVDGTRSPTVKNRCCRRGFQYRDEQCCEQ